MSTLMTTISWPVDLALVIYRYGRSLHAKISLRQNGAPLLICAESFMGAHSGLRVQHQAMTHP
jgi:hypothetical protein